MLMIFFYLLKAALSCTNSKGSYVLKVKIHLDELTHLKIRAMKKIDKNGTRVKVTEYLDKLFNEVNTELKIFGVQVEGDYSELVFEELELGLIKEKICEPRNIATKVTAQVLPLLSYPNTEGLGLRIVGISCTATRPEQVPFFMVPSYTCGNLATILVLDPYSLKRQIKLILKSFVTNGIGLIFYTTSRWYKRAICKYVNSCSKNMQHIGEYKEDITAVLHGTKKNKKAKKSKKTTGLLNLRSKKKWTFFGTKKVEDDNSEC